jgi:vacuolar protein sorting-associated protein 26
MPTTAGELTATKAYPFDFENVDKQYDSYNGINVKLRYFLRVTVSRQYSPNIVQEMDLWVKNVIQAPVSTV